MTPPGLEALTSLQAQSTTVLVWMFTHWKLLSVVYGIVFLFIAVLKWGYRRPRAHRSDGYRPVKWSGKWGLWRAGCFRRQGMLLGVANGWFWRPYIRAPREHSVVLFAPPGEGKSQLVMATLVGCPDDSALIIDLSGELVDLTAPFRRQCGSIYIWNPTDPHSDRLNTWGFIRWGTSYEDGDIQRACSHVVTPLAQHTTSGAEHFERVADTTLGLTMRYVAYTRPRAEHNFAGTLRLMASPGQSIQALLQQMSQHPHPRIQLGAALMLKETPQKIRDDWAAAVEWLRRWEDSHLALATSETTIPWWDLQYGSQPMTMYLRLSLDDAKNRLHRLLRMNLDLLMHQLTQLSAPHPRRHLNVIPDDIGALGDFPTINDIPVEKRKYYIHLMAPFQAITQARAELGRYTGLLNSCQSWVISWQGDPDSAEYLERKIAETTVVETMDSISGGRGRGWTKRAQTRTTPLLPSGAIQSLRPHQQVFCIRHRRYLGRRLSVYEDANFRRRLALGK